MKRLWNEFRLFLRFRSTRAEPIEWREEDRIQLQRFLDTDNGKRLLTVMAFESYNQDRQATCNTKDLAWACGVAVGFRICMAVLTNLSVGEPTLAEKPQGAKNGADALRERVSP